MKTKTRHTKSPGSQWKASCQNTVLSMLNSSGKWCHRICMYWWLTHCVHVKVWMTPVIMPRESVNQNTFEYIMRKLAKMNSGLCKCKGLYKCVSCNKPDFHWIKIHLSLKTPRISTQKCVSHTLPENCMQARFKRRFGNCNQLAHILSCSFHVEASAGSLPFLPRFL